MAYIFRLILLCIPLFGAVAATAEVQRIDRGHAEKMTIGDQQVEPDMVLALNTVVPVMLMSRNTASSTDTMQTVTPEVMAGASAGLPVCLALVLLVTLIRQRV